MLDILRQDVHYAWRSLRRAPGFAAAAVLTLAIGIGATTAVYSVVDAVLVEPIPFSDDDRLVVVWETDRDSGTTREPASFPDFVDFRQRSTQFDRVAALNAGETNLTADRADPRRLARLSVTADLLPTLGVRPLLGRSFNEADDRPGSPAVVLLSEQLWNAQYQRDAAIIGRSINLNGRPHAIIGVLPESAGFGAPQILNAAAYSRGFAARDAGAQVDIWLPLRGDAATMPRANHPLLILGRLRAGASAASAQEELSRIATDLERAFPENQARGVFVETLTDVVMGPMRPALLTLLAGVAFLLLIACVNVANLLMARAAARAREISVRSALGAGAARLVRQCIVESTLLTLVAAAAGVCLAAGGLRVLLALAPPQLPRLAHVSIDMRVLGVMIGVSTVIAVTFGLLPLLQWRRADLQATLRANSTRADVGDRRARARRATLVAAEISLAVALAIAAGLMLRTVAALRQVNPGFDSTNVVKLELQLPASRYPADFRDYPNLAATHRFNATLVERVLAVPGVSAAGLAGNQPLDVGFTNSFAIVGREAEAVTWPEISVRRVTPGYLRALRVRLLQGRFIDDRDGTAAPPVALINEAAAERFFPRQDPLGHEIAFWGIRRRIVGVIVNEKFQGLAAQSPIAVYAPLAQTPSIDGSQALVVRATGDIRPALRDVVRSIDPELAVFGVEPLDATLANSIREQRFLMELLRVFALIAITLAAIGIHGVLSYTLVQRTGEIGVRLALGATRRDVVRLIVGQSARVTAIGLVAGTAVGLALTQWLQKWLYGVSPTDHVTLAGVLMTLGTVAAISSYVPTRRATRLNPVDALRTE